VTVSLGERVISRGVFCCVGFPGAGLAKDQNIVGLIDKVTFDQAGQLAA
jgi:hypothetical protein